MIEHFALDVADPVGMAEWYVEHLGLIVARHIPVPSQGHFLTDARRVVAIEIYRNTDVQTPDYANLDPLLLHLAFTSEHPMADKERLLAAGATFVSEQNFPDGSCLVMLRDPWGLAVQLCKRGKPLF